MTEATVRRARLSASIAAQAAAASPAPGPLSIANCKAYAVREPVSRREYAILRLETTSGIVGWGETRTIAAAELAQALAILRGRQATEYSSLHARLAALPDLRAAANIALLDIVGQAVKAPVHQVLGGPTRHKARALAVVAGAEDDVVLAACRRARTAGFRAFVIPAVAPSSRNSGRPFVAANRKRMEALRAALGEDSDFVVDCAAALTPGDAASLSDALEHLHPLWLDEPCEITSLAAIRKLAGERVTPLGFGRSMTTSAAFQNVVREDLIDVFRPELGRNGITQIRKFAALAEANYIAVAPYHDGGPVGTAAALHLAASLPNFFAQQIPLPDADEDRRFRAALAGVALESVTDGYLALPTEPGLGLKIDRALLGKEVA
jgi:galactonate dehydratase